MLRLERTLSTPLPCLVPLRPGQTYWSFVSSLAARNGFASIAHFREIFGMGRRYFDPPDFEIDQIAAMGSVDSDELAGRATRVIDSAMFSIANQQVRQVLKPTDDRMRVCPLCLREDLAGLNGIDQDAAPFLRLESTIEVVTGCPRHEMAFVDPAVDATNSNDIAYHMRKRRAEGLALPEVPHVPSSASNYFAGRMRGEGGLSAPFLDTMSLSDAIDTCGLLGGFASNARGEKYTHRWGQTPLMDQYRQAGFEVARYGEGSVRELLQGRIDSTCHGQGLAHVFGTMSRTLTTSKPSVLSALRSLVADVAVANVIPFASANTVFGLPMPERKRLTVAAAAKVFRVDERILDEVLVDRGAIAPKPLRGHAVPVISVDEHRQLLGDLNDYLNVDQVAKRFGVTHAVVLTLTRLGFITPFLVRQSKRQTPMRHYRPIEIERFLEGMTGKATLATDPPSDFAKIETAAMRAGRSAESVYQLAIGGQLKSLLVCKIGGNLRDLRVSVSEVRALVRNPTDYLNSRQVAAILGTCSEAARRMGINGLIPSTLSPNPVNTRRERSFRQSDIAAFKATYVFLPELWKLGDGQKSVKRRLRDYGTKPAFPYTAARMFIFRRDELPPELRASR